MRCTEFAWKCYGCCHKTPGTFDDLAKRRAITQGSWTFIYQPCSGFHIKRAITNYLIVHKNKTLKENDLKMFKDIIEPLHELLKDSLKEILQKTDGHWHYSVDPDDPWDILYTGTPWTLKSKNGRSYFYNSSEVILQNYIHCEYYSWVPHYLKQFLLEHNCLDVIEFNECQMNTLDNEDFLENIRS